MNALTKREEGGALARTEETPKIALAPAVDVGETAEEYFIAADLPGIDPDAIDLTFSNGMLHLVGKMKPRMTEDIAYSRNEYAVGDFRRTFDLEGCQIDAEGIAAEYTNGVLAVKLPKAEHARPLRIEVK